MESHEKKNIFSEIRKLGNSWGLYEEGDPITQHVKLSEEVGELAKALLLKDLPKVIDGVGDTVVVLTNLCVMLDIKIEDCIEMAYAEIKNRKGRMINGTFVKQETIDEMYNNGNEVEHEEANTKN